MTIRYEYICPECQHVYIEQRGKDEPNAYFTICSYCKKGTYEETAKIVIAAEPERVSAEKVFAAEIIDVEEVTPTPALEG